ncbi:hypothetical protein ACFL38_00955 [Candidatus Omnitrophota bacterium]
MMKNSLPIIFSVALVLFVSGCSTPDNTAEKEFKSTVLAMKQEFVKTEDLLGKNGVSDEELVKSFAYQKDLIKEWVKELKKVVKHSPANIWADDAQYIISTLYAGSPQLEIQELEHLLKNYPDIHIEQWTRENLPDIAQQADMGCFARISLCLLYRKLQYVNELKALGEESINKCPEKEKILEQILRH